MGYGLSSDINGIPEVSLKSSWYLTPGTHCAHNNSPIIFSIQALRDDQNKVYEKSKTHHVSYLCVIEVTWSAWNFAGASAGLLRHLQSFMLIRCKISYWLHNTIDITISSLIWVFKNLHFITISLLVSPSLYHCESVDRWIVFHSQRKLICVICNQIWRQSTSHQHKFHGLW